MSDWKQGIKDKLAHLPDSCREATIAQVIADTEAGVPFASVADTPKEAEEVTPEAGQKKAPRPVPNPGPGPGRAW